VAGPRGRARRATPARLVAGGPDDRPGPRVLHHRARRDDHRRAPPGPPRVRAWAECPATLRDTRAALRQHLGRRDTPALRGAAGRDGCRSLGLELRFHAEHLRVEGARRDPGGERGLRGGPSRGGGPAPPGCVAVPPGSPPWPVLVGHTPVLFVGGFLVFLAFTHATAPYQSSLNLRPALLVGFFLARLVVHGALQHWWMEPVLSRLPAAPLFVGSIV